MVYLARAVANANAKLSPASDEAFAPDDLIGLLEGVDRVADAVGPLGLADHIPASAQAVLFDFLDNLPRAVDKAIVEVARDALQRGLRVLISWQPEATTKVQVFETSREEDGGLEGVVHIVLTSPDPEAAAASPP